MRYLYLNDSSGKNIEVNAQCVLDFYVHNSLQKLGYGKQLFDKMLRFLNLDSYSLAYDFPSKQILNFLYKYYSLKDIILQYNKFGVFKEFFTVKYII